jgi:iron complex outermembrane receptor protein
MGTLRVRSVPRILLRLSLAGALVVGRTISNAADPIGETAQNPITTQPSPSEPAASETPTPTARPAEPSTPQGATKPLQPEEVVVTGTRLEVKKGEGPQEVQVYTEEVIRRSGQTTLGDFMNTLPSVSLIVDPGSLATAFFGTGVRLHGLPLGTALVLIDGRRIETTSADAFNDIFDLNNVPLAAVERIEVLPQGSSAIYGSDAIAGVVNIILRKDFEGFAGTVKYGAADDTNAFNTNLAWGGRWNHGTYFCVTKSIEL